MTKNNKNKNDKYTINRIRAMNKYPKYISEYSDEISNNDYSESNYSSATESHDSENETDDIYSSDEEMYLRSIHENNDTNAMSFLGNFYEKTNNIKLMKKYYLMAIKNKNSSGMISFALYYKKINNTKIAIKYLLMAINLKDENTKYAAHILGDYYKTLKQFDKMIKYYIIAIKLDHAPAMVALGFCYETVQKYKFLSNII